MRTYYRLLLFTVLISSSWTIQAQEVWDLPRCINYALENNLQIKQQVLQTEISEVNVNAAKGNVLPTLNAFGSHSYNWGQRIDPFTNQFASQRVRSNNFFISSNFTVFSGLQRTNSIKQSQLDLKASQYGVDRTRNDISLFLANNYLQILFNEELAQIARQQLQISKQQVDRTEKLVNAGSLPKGNLYDIQAQMALEEANVVTAENNLTISYLNLKQFLQLEADKEIAISRPNINIDNLLKIDARPGQVYDAAVRTLPEIKQAEYSLASADKGVAVARGAKSPTLSVNASYGTGYSGLAMELVNPGTSTETRTVPFANQIENNLNRTFGVQLNIPILNGFSAQTSINRAKISQEIAQVQLETEKNTVRLNVEQAYADAVAALKQYRATEKSVAALNESFTYAQKRFDVGLMNAVDYNDAKNNLARAESDLVRAKYDFIFKTKVLDFYQGKPLVF